MIIDIIFLVLLVMGAVKGYRQGLIVGIFSYVALLIGLAAAMKLSAVVASRLGEVVKISDKWLPFLAFALIFIFVLLIVKWVARLVQSAFEAVMLGWLNRLGGIIFFVVINISIYAIVLFYISQLKILPESIDNSVTYNIIKPFGRYAIDTIGYIIPYFKNMFADLESFFGNVANKAN